MSAIHVLTGKGDNTYLCVVHIAIPNTNNPVGTNWRAALINSGIGGKTILAEGTGPGQITTQEKALIASGALYEITLAFQDMPAWTNQQRVAELQARAAEVSEQALARLQAQLKYFGAAQ